MDHGNVVLFLKLKGVDIMGKHFVKGLFTELITPFKEDGSID